MLLLLFCFTMANDNSNIIDVKTYQNPNEKDPFIFVSDPWAFNFSPQGELFLIDRADSLIHIWDTNGNYRKSFGAVGNGPGEMNYPYHIQITEKEAWIIDLTREISIFDHDGKFQRSFKIQGNPIRTFSILSEDLLLITHPDNELNQVFQFMDGKGNRKDILKTFVNNMFMSENRQKAFGPDAEIQKTADGDHLIGFSESGTLFRLGADGKIKGQTDFEFQTRKPTKEEMEKVTEATFPSPWAAVKEVRMDNFVRRQLTFDFDMAYYTYFLKKGDKIAFVLTLGGSLWGIGIGYADATYKVYDFKTGKMLSAGRYSLPKDSLLLYENGRALACVVDEEGDFQVKEVTLKGLEP